MQHLWCCQVSSAMFRSNMYLFTTCGIKDFTENMLLLQFNESLTFILFCNLCTYILNVFLNSSRYINIYILYYLMFILSWHHFNTLRHIEYIIVDTNPLNDATHKVFIQSTKFLFFVSLIHPIHSIWRKRKINDAQI